jgi:type III pantothenate kinase
VTLLVDAGSTGLQWARLVDGRLAGLNSAPHHGHEPEAWQAPLAALAPAPRRVVVANVAGHAFEARFRDWAERQWQVTPQFPASAAEQLGLTNAYVRPGALGIDRWLAMLAAWRDTGAPLLVASAGTAFSVDLVDGDGRHRGGCIVPGERLMREALHAQTSGVAAAALLDRAAIDGVFGINTAGAVQQGARLALASLVDRAARLLETATGRAPRIFVAGGAAPELAPLVVRAVELAPHLVLTGLALVAAERPA